MATVALLTGLTTVVAMWLSWAHRRYPPDRGTLVDAIDGLLPQTQCAQCGYPGCRPYAEAVADGAPENLCPPGGPVTQEALARLLGRKGAPPPDKLPSQKAVIDESRCIGCFQCVDACPVDAIIGAPDYTHTVLESACTGCGLCLAPCPVDCIELIGEEVPGPATRARRRWPAQPTRACIRCGRCEPACPVDLNPQELLWFIASDAAEARGLHRCIECGLCNAACPSNIDLVQQFTVARRAQADREAARGRATAARERFDSRQRRLRAAASARHDRRHKRIAAGSRRWRP